MGRFARDAMNAYYGRDAEGLARLINHMENIMEKSTVLSIARVAHEINRAYCLSLGDYTQPVWEEAPNWQRDSACKGVQAHLDNPDLTPEQSHELWMKQKVAEGWVFGVVKDGNAKTHPCIRPYSELPPEQRAKDYLFRGTVHAIAREMARPN